MRCMRLWHLGHLQLWAAAQDRFFASPLNEVKIYFSLGVVGTTPRLDILSKNVLCQYMVYFALNCLDPRSLTFK